jgi:hypothetical protein
MDWREELRNIETDISEEEVFEAIRRGYNDLENATDDEIINYFENSNSEELAGHISNIKGILFENEIQDKENKFEMTTNSGLLHFGFDYDFSKHHSISAVYEMSVYANSDSDTIHTTNGIAVSSEFDEIKKWSVNYQYKF